MDAPLPAGSGSEPQDATPPTTPVPAADSVPVEATLLGSFLYGLSLPERTARSVTAVAGGLLCETASRLIPGVFRSSKSYALFVQQALDMAVHDFGGVPNTVAPPPSQQETMLAQKAVGGLLDIASVSTLHLSPMTLLAAFSDIAYGSGHYLRELSTELKRQGVIDQDSSIDHISDLLEALQAASNQATDTLDKPPVNIEGLRQTIQQTRDSINSVDPTKLIPQSEIARMWSEMEAEASAADVGLLDVSATMTMFAMNRLTLVSRGALSSVTVAGNLLDQHILNHYEDALKEIHKEGLYATLSTASAPYWEAVWNNFDDDRMTWTEDFLSGKMIDRTIDGLRGWWRRSKSE